MLEIGDKKSVLPISGAVHAQIILPGSKSLTNRALLLAALANGVSELSEILISDDTEAFSAALRALGISIQWDTVNRRCIVIGCGGTFPVKKAHIDCHDAGTVARFLLAACAASAGQYTFDGSLQLRNRPLASLVHVLRRQGVIIASDNDGLPLTLSGEGKLPGGDITIDASDSGQFVSALLMAAPLFRTSVTMEANDPVNRPFIQMTIGMMAEFGVLVRQLLPDRFSIPVPQHYHAHDYVIEPDLSTAACFFAAAAVSGGEVTIQPVDLEHSLQGDARFLSLLQKMGCEVISHTQGLTVRGTDTLQGISVDMSDCSDTFMALAAIAPFASTYTTITNIGHTRHQESDRITVMCQGLEKLGVRVEQGADWIRIYPGLPSAGEIDAHNDHRIAMAFSVVGLRVGVTVKGAGCVSKTCPEFYELWDSLY